MPNTKRSLVSKAALALGTWVAYVLAFIPLYHLVGTPVATLSILPVVAMGWLFGMRAGLLASLLTFPLNVLLMTLAGGASGDMMNRAGLTGSILLVLIGAVVGRLRDLGERVKRELAERKRAEETQRRAAQAALLYEVGQRVSGELELEPLLSEIVTAVCDAFDYYGVILMLLDEEAKRLTLQSVAGGYAGFFPEDLWIAVGEGMTGYAAATGETQISGDVSKHPHYVRKAEEETKSELAVPIKSGQKIIGVLDLQSDKLDAFDETDVMLMETLADQVAVAIKNARLYETTQRQSERLAQTLEASELLHRGLELEQVFEQVAQGAVKLGFRRAAINIFYLEEELVRVHAVAGMESPEREMLMDATYSWSEFQTLIQERFRVSRSYLIRQGEMDWEQDFQGVTIDFVKKDRGPDYWRPKDMLLVPFWGTGGQPVGALSVDDPVDGLLPDLNTIQTLETFANQAAVAIENARLFEEASNRAERLAVVNRIAKAAGATLHLDDLMETVYQEITPAFQADAFFIALHDEETGELDFRLEVDEGVRQPPARLPPGTGLSSVVVSEMKPLIIRDFEQERDRLPAAVLWGTEKPPASWLGAPMLVGERVIGIINVQSYRPNVWDEEDELLLFTIADQIAVAIENARLFEEARSHTEELEAINEVGRTITSVLDLDAVLRQIVNITKVRFGHYFVGIALVEGDQLTFWSGSTIGDSDVRPGFSRESVDLTYRPSLATEAARTGQSVLANDVLSDPRYLAMQKLPDTRSELCIPIKAKGRVIGVLDVQSDRPHAFDQTDVALHQSLASQAGVAIENARLFEQAQIRAQELAVLNELGQALTARLSVEEVLDEAHRQASRLLDTTNFFIALYDPEKDEITFPFIVSESEIDRQITVMSADEGVSGYIVRNRTSVLTQENVVEQLEEMGVELVGEPAPSWLGVPLIVGDRVLGVIAVQSYTTPRLYDEHDRDLLTAIASQAAIAIQNARLYEEIQQELAERKRADEALQESERRFRSIAETASDAVIIFDSHENIFFWNHAAQDIFGYLAGETQDKLLSSILSERFHKDFRRGMKQLVSTGESDLIGKAIEVTGVRKDGSEFPLELSLATWRTREDIFFTAIARDITERKQAEDALERRAAQLALISDVGGKIAAVLELDSVLDRTAHLVQESFGYHHVALFTVDREQDELVMRVRAGDFVHLFPPDHRLKLGQGMVGWVGSHGEALLANDVDAEPRYVNLYPDIVPTQSELSVPIRVGRVIVGVLDVQSPQLNAFDENDVVVIETLADQIAAAIENARLYEAVQRELTERKWAERQLRRYAAELEQANEEIKQFAYIVSHDLRAPLVNLKGFAAELRSALETVGPAMNTALPHLDEKQQQAVTTALQEDVPEALGFIDSSVTRMDAFIKAVLELSRLGHRELGLEPIDMDALVQATLQTLAHQIEQRQVQVTVGALPEVIADRTSMEQIMGNILGNAVKYLDPDRPGEIKVTAESGDGETTFLVRDNGCGIAEKDMDKVFAPFRRAGRQDVPGEGMGLAYVQTLVRRHGGRIWCESEPGVGTMFTFTIPHHLAKGVSHV